MDNGFKSYLITDPSFYSSLEEFENYLTNIYKNHSVDFSCYRDKSSFSKEYAKLFLTISKKFDIEYVLLNSYLDVAVSLGFDGVHLTSSQFDLIKKAKKRDLFTIVSTHDDKQITKAKTLGADAVTFSPVFSTPNKGSPKGLEALKKAVCLSYPLKCFALGGIVTDKEVKECKKAGSYGFASIRYFTVK